jgi:hypothetical protein
MRRKDIGSLLERNQDRVPDSAEDFLDTLGLQRKRSAASVILPAVGTLFLGAAIGSALGMLFGPRYGYQLMDRMGVKIPEKLREGMHQETRSTTANNAAGVSVPRPRSEIHS